MKPNPNKHRYRKVALKMWGDETFARLTPMPPSGQSLWIYLLACPLPDVIPGVYRTGRASLAEQLGWEIEEFDACFKEIADLGMAKADWKRKLLWLPNAAKYNPPESPSVVIYWSKAWAEIPECELKSEIFQSLKAHICAIGKGFAEAFAASFNEPPNPRGNGVKVTSDKPKINPESHPGAQGVTQAGSQADVQPDTHPASQPANPHKQRTNQAGGQGVCQAGGQGVPHQEQEQEQEQYEMREGGVGEVTHRGASPSAPPALSGPVLDEGLGEQRVPAGGVKPEPDAQQQPLAGFDLFRGPEVIDEVQQAVRDAQSSTGTRLPVDFVVPQQWVTYARRTRPDLPDEQIRDIAASFVRYWLAKPGKDGRKLNWLATWLNWVDRERKQQSAGNSDQRPQPRLMEPSNIDSDESRRRTLEIAKRYGARVTGLRKPGSEAF